MSEKVNFRKKIRKYCEFILTKIKVLFEQKYFNYHDTILKYMLKKSKSDKLVIVFSSCTRKGLRARYNYVRTLKNVDCNQLFILDDFAEGHRGGYYIGSNFRFNDEKATVALIKKIQAELGIKETIYCGSSKGGWAALNIGLQFEKATIIIGGPQYFLADYLLKSGNIDTLNYIIGEKNEQKLTKLNTYLREKIENNKYIDSQKIYVHYSNKEHTYKEHIKDLLEDLYRMQYNITENVGDYTCHSDISYHFPDFLINTLSESFKI